MKEIIGWDIGGAHLKAARIDRTGTICDVALYSTPLWKGLDYLRSGFEKIVQQMQGTHCTHVITMTGELVDLFNSRDEGVAKILKVVSTVLGENYFVYAGIKQFIPAQQVTETDYDAIASMNWMASASVAAMNVEKGLFIDVGSTTTDILLLHHGKLEVIGTTDYQRLISGELIYTGIVRTAVMAVAQQAEFNGHQMGLMAEYFATMADVYRVTGELTEAHDCSDTADGGEKTPLASAIRLSRMTGYDFKQSDWAIWQKFAEEIKSIQLEIINAGYKRQRDRLENKNDITIVGAGIGRFLLEQIAQQQHLEYIDFNDIIPHRLTDSHLDVADCAPAAAMATLFFKSQ